MNLFKDWQEWDMAGYELGQLLKLIPADWNFATDAKHVFWTDHAIGRLIQILLDELVSAGAVDMQERDGSPFYRARDPRVVAAVLCDGERVAPLAWAQIQVLQTFMRDERQDLSPVVGPLDEGMVMEWVKDGRYHIIECFEDGAIAYLERDPGPEPVRRAYDLNLMQMLERLRA